MTIKAIMNIGCKGMSSAAKAAEQERRLKVAERINLLDRRITGYKAELKGCEKGSPAAKHLNSKVRGCVRELNRIKGDESLWLKEAAWFLYA